MDLKCFLIRELRPGMDHVSLDALAYFVRCYETRRTIFPLLAPGKVYTLRRHDQEIQYLHGGNPLAVFLLLNGFATIHAKEVILVPGNPQYEKSLDKLAGMEAVGIQSFRQLIETIPDPQKYVVRK